MQKCRCTGAEMQVQRFRGGAEMQRWCKGAEMQMQRFRGAGAEVQVLRCRCMCIGAEVQRPGAEVVQRGVEVQVCRFAGADKVLKCLVGVEVVQQR